MIFQNLKQLMFSFSNLKGKGEIYVVSILGVIILGSAFLVGGMFPDLNQVTNPLDSFTPKEKKGNKNNGAVQLIQLDAKKNPRNNNQNNNQNNQNRSNPPACQNNGAIALLIDLSASMQASNKMTKLKNALKSFSNDLSNTTFVGMYTFASPNVGDKNVGTPEKEPKQRLPFGKFNKGSFDRAVGQLKPYVKPPADGATYMRDGLEYVSQKISQSKDDNPGKRFSLIFISDGVPELIECVESHMPNGVCQPDRNYDYTQDPTLDPNVASQIKNSGVTIYSIAIFDPSDLIVTPKLKQIMQTIAGSNDPLTSQQQLYFESANGDDLAAKYQQISSIVCK